MSSNTPPPIAQGNQVAFARVFGFEEGVAVEGEEDNESVPFTLL
jgi:hypothetical protein